MGYADYDVSVTAPEGWLIAATGELENADQVLSAQMRERLAQARRSPTVVHVVTTHDHGAGRATLKGERGRLTWRFRAHNVRDFAFAASGAFVWDATVADVGDRDGDGVPDSAGVNSLYRPNRAWRESARYVKHAVEFLSRFLWPYPYPHMTAVEGPVSGGMEYPMVTLIGGLLGAKLLFTVTVHEVAHMWFPMQVGSDEKRYSWQDEGLASYNEAQGVREFLKEDAEREAQHAYLASAGDGVEAPLIRHGDEYPSEATYTLASYDKPTAIFRALRGVLGDSVFMRAYREYGRRWLGKHPQPQDLWNTFNDVSGRDLSWFWRAWFLETWTLDQAIASVRSRGDSAEVVIENRGRAPMPVRLALTRADGSVERMELPVDIWLSGTTRYTVRVPNTPALTRVVIDPEELFPDTDRGNNRWKG
jgi:Peptidase family M1 domain